MTPSFPSWFQAATGTLPYRFQQRFAESATPFDVLRVPTGAGKTATAVLGWLFRRRFASEATRKATPRRLVYCLPMRTLVEQTVACARHWIRQLGLRDDVPVHVLLGGDADDDWALRPQGDAVLVGTQDMLLSRALNRGYAQGRFRWPIDFGLLNNDCLWVFDELQLMGAGVSTSAQLAGLRERLGGFGPGCRSVWMSATMDRRWLATIDFQDRVPTLNELHLDDDELTTGELGKRMQARKILKPAMLPSEKNSARVAEAVKKAHQEGTLTLVVVNTVDRATDLFRALRKTRGSATEVMLLHSRFRPRERGKLNVRLSSGFRGIVVATQVVEAGVDLSARVLFTELAPWPSLVQRFGRCHRRAEHPEGGEVFWLDLAIEKNATPYEPEDLAFARTQLERLAGMDVSPLALGAFEREQGITLPFEHRHVLRRRDLLGLFDTAPDLSGNDIDVAPYVRGDDPERDVSVFWRDFDPGAKPSDQPSPHREELCPVPVGKLKAFLKEGDLVAYRLDHIDDEWVPVRSHEVRPGLVLLLPTVAGGYDWDEQAASGRGWCGEPDAKPGPVERALPRQSEGEEGVAADGWSRGPAQTLAGHTIDVCNALEESMAGMDLGDLDPTELREAARHHDVGKVHAVFQESIRKANGALPGDQVWAKSGGSGPLRHGRRHFRHELASALAMLQQGRSFLAAYLVGAHHGRVRLAIRSLPNETIPPEPGTRFALGIREGDELTELDLGQGHQSGRVVLDLSPMTLGRGSWTERALELLRRWGPFRLAFLEAVLRAADMTASMDPRTEVRHG